ncbi:MAG: hypothetical protein GY940_47840 [bacterium]|nr:hypothetical protein [bacterium]
MGKGTKTFNGNCLQLTNSTMVLRFGYRPRSPMVFQDEAGFKIAVRNLSETGKNRPAGVLLLIIGAETIVFAVQMGENPVPPVHEDVAFLLDDVKAGPDAPGYVPAATESRNALHLLLHALHLSRNASHSATGAGTQTLHAFPSATNAGTEYLNEA